MLQTLGAGPKDSYQSVIEGSDAHNIKRGVETPQRLMGTEEIKTARTSP